jgi:UDPglucose 6-dehydrogenase
MREPKVGVVGAGVVGTAVKDVCGPHTVMYDKRTGYCNDKKAVNACDAVFVCVPTPMKSNGACDTSLVEEVVAWINSPLIIIRSTVPPGTTDRLRQVHGKSIVFQPEYLGETTAHVYGSSDKHKFIVLGGTAEDTSKAADFYKHYFNSMVRFYFCDAKTAELAKYMENAFFAVKVTFVNELCDIAEAHGVDFNVLREIWLADRRISRDHTFVYPNARGFSGKCLPKDMNAIVRSSEDKGYKPTFLKAALEVNEYFLKLNDQKKVDAHNSGKRD